MHSCGNTAIKAEVGPTSGPTWRLSHLGGAAGRVTDADAVAAAGDVDVVGDGDVATLLAVAEGDLGGGRPVRELPAGLAGEVIRVRADDHRQC